MPKTFAVLTLGCRVNQYESRALADLLRSRSWVETDLREAENIVVNACAVTGKGSRKTRRLIHRLCRTRPRRRVFVMGCMTAEDRAALLAFPQVRAVVSPLMREDIVKALTGKPGRLELRGRGPRSRVYLKVQDGCSRKCSYCIVPSLRGPSRSRPLADVLRELDAVLRDGVPEIWIVGTNLSSWGGKRFLEQLGIVARRVKEAGARLRLGTVGLDVLTDEFERLLGANSAICRHLHLSLQSGSGRIRRLMGRRTAPEEIRAAIARFKRAFPRLALSADVMVGFPGEGEEDFAATRELCEEAGFMKLHIFPYSPRPGTGAENSAEAVPRSIVFRRCEELARLERELYVDFCRRLLGSVLTVVVEKTVPYAEGRAEEYVRVRFRPEGGETRPGSVERVKITEFRDGVLWGSRYGRETGVRRKGDPAVVGGTGGGTGKTSS